MIKAEKIYDETFSAVNLSSSPKSTQTLQGDTYDYEVIIMCDDASGDSILDVTCNSDTTSNYRNYEMKGSSSTASASTGDSNTAIEIQNFIGTANSNLLIMKISGESGDERYIDSFYSADGAILKQSSYWKNTADELDELTFTAASSVTCDIHIIIYRTPKVSSQSRWELVGVHSLSSVNVNTSPDSFTGLSLDEDRAYKYKFDLTEASSGDLGIRFNSDSSTNYLGQELRNSGTVDSQTRSGLANIYINDTGSSARVKGSYLIEGDSSTKRIAIGGNTQTAKAFQQIQECWWWNNVVDDLDEISLVSHSGSSTSTSGTIKLYRLINPTTTGDTLPFEIMGNISVSGDYSAGDTISGLTLDNDSLIKIEGLFSTVGNDLRLQFNGDTGSNYTDQYVKGVASSASASNSTTTYHLLCDASSSKVAIFELYLYPKSGENRPALLRVGHGEDSIEYKALWWLNSVDEISSIKIFASGGTTCTGDIKLSRLSKNINEINLAADTLLLNGTDETLDLSNDSSIRLIDDFLYNIWVYPTSFSENKYLWSRYDLSGTNRALLIRLLSSSGFIGVVTSTNGSSTVAHSSSIAVPLNEWSMVSVRMTGGNIMLSMNAGTEESFSQADLNVGSGQSYIGSFQNVSEFFAGSMDGALLLNSGDDVREELYNNGISVQPWLLPQSIKDNMALGIPLNSETDGNEYSDYSGNANDATPVNSPTITGEELNIITSRDPSP